MSLSSDEIFNHAIDALKTMLRLYGPDYKFPPDAIWLNVSPAVNADLDIPSTARSHQPKRLMDANYIELTGGMEKAQTKQAAGSIRKQYRFGSALVTPTTTPMVSAAILPSERLKGIQVAMEAKGYIVSTAELANFYLAMTVSPLVILSGISGTGKSLLPRRFAQLTNSGFKPIPVQPQWSDNSDLFGYVPTLSPNKYINGALTDSLLKARAEPENLVIALLDEMNLAPVEHYFSDFLSVAETRERVGGRVITDPLPIELPSLIAGIADFYADLRGATLPSNLRVVGTANMDESTHVFSPKVLDRAFTIELDDPVLTDFAPLVTTCATDPDIDFFKPLAMLMIQESNPISVMEARAESQAMFEHIAGLLGEIQEILAPAGIKFGYRTRDAILLYLHFWRLHNLADIMTGYAALDLCILQKILPKVSGSGDALSDALKKLVIWLTARETLQTDDSFPEFAGKLERSVRKAERMDILLDLDGATRFWGA